MGSQWKRTLGLLPLLLCGTALYANVIGNPHVDFRQSFALGPGGRVLIQNLYGDVSITAWDREEVLVEAIKHCTDPRRMDDARVIVEPSAAGLSIHTVYTGTDAEHPASVEYRIMVPRRANLDQIKLVNGGLSISGVAGPVKASSVNGSIHADKLEGQAELSTVNGKLDAAFQRVSASAPIYLSSVNGPIKLSLPAGAGASVNAHNLSGGIESDVGKVSRADDGHDLHALVNHGGAQVQVHNINGGISIHSKPCTKGRG
jgi:hypothetical protein